MYEGKDGGIPANIHDIPFFKEQLDTMQMIPCGYHLSLIHIYEHSFQLPVWQVY